MEQYIEYLRKSRFDRDYLDLSVEETLKRHQEILDRLARDRGFYIAKVYREVVSGESIAARPEVQKMLEEVSSGIYTGVLVVDVERLARGNSADQAYISQIFQFSDTKIITPAKTYDPTDEFDQEYFEFGLFMSRREYKTINRRLVRGRQSSASEGKYVGSIAPYGYDRVKLQGEKGYTLEPNPAEAEAVRRMFELYVRRQGTKMIANELNDRKIPTRHGGKWDASTVGAILINPVYLGKIKRGYVKETKRLDERGNVVSSYRHCKDVEDYELYEGRHPALIDDALFEKAQRIRKENYVGPKVKKQYELVNPFAGVMVCAECGKPIGRKVSSKNHPNPPRVACTNPHHCHNRSATFALVETEILNALRSWLDGYRIRLDTVGFAEDIADCRRQLERIEAEREKLKAQLDRAYTLVEQGVYSLEVFGERRDKLTRELNELQEQQDAAEQSIAQFEADESSQQEIIPQTETLLASYDDMTVQERNELLKTILYKIEYYRGEDGIVSIDLYPRLPKA